MQKQTSVRKVATLVFPA